MFWAIFAQTIYVFKKIFERKFAKIAIDPKYCQKYELRILFTLCCCHGVGYFEGGRTKITENIDSKILMLNSDRRDRRHVTERQSNKKRFES
jgi:hypothetical protein